MSIVGPGPDKIAVDFVAGVVDTPMNARTHAIAVPLLLVATTLVASGPASAMYMITPLALNASAYDTQVGDLLKFTITPNADHEGPSWAGQTIRVQYNYDPNEGREPASNESPDAAVSDGEDQASPYVFVDLPGVTLDEKESGAFEWTIPADVDDRNVFVVLLSADGETLASVNVRVGDAAPLMMLMAGNGPTEVEQTPVTDTAAPPADDAAAPQTQDETSANNVPALGLGGALVAAGVAVALLARRR